MPFSHRGHEVNTIVVDRRAISFSSEYHAQSLLGGRHRQVNIAARGAHGRRDGRGRARRRSARCIAAVVRHVCLDKVASGQSGTQQKGNHPTQAPFRPSDLQGFVHRCHSLLLV